MLICQFISFAINPWFLLGSASIFITFLGSYQIFLAAITGILICNYYVISRGYLQVPDLYTGDKSGVYYFTKGWNIRAYVAYLITVAVNFAGFLGNMGVHVPIGIKRFYYFAYPVGITMSFGIFWICNLIWPPAHHMPLSEWHEPGNYTRPDEDPQHLTALEGSCVHEVSKEGLPQTPANEGESNSHKSSFIVA